MVSRGAVALAGALLSMSGCLEAPPSMMDDDAGCIAGDHPNTFDTSSMACTPWGAVNESSATLTQDGALVIVLAQGAGEAYGGCYSNALNALSRGVTAEVSAVLEGAQDYTQLQAVEGEVFRMTFRVEPSMPGSELPMLSASTSAGIFHQEVFDPMAHRWWRIRSLSDQVHFEVSPDGTAWTGFASPEAPPPPAQVYINMNAGSHDAATTTGEARFESVNTCP